MKQSHQDILAHMTKHYGKVQDTCLQEIVPATGITIHVVPPAPGETVTLLFTVGMSDRPQTVPEGFEQYRYTELMIGLPGDWPIGKPGSDADEHFWPIEWLRKIGWYPHDNDTWLGGPFTIIANDEPPKPLAPNTKLSCLLLLRRGGEAGMVRCRDGREIVLYSMLPLYEEERDLEREQGMEKLFELFEKYEVSPVVNINRANTAVK